MVELSRRKLFQLAAFGLASRMLPFGAVNAFAAPTGTLGPYQALVCIFLFGGNASNNMVVPRSKICFVSLLVSQLGDQLNQEFWFDEGGKTKQ